MPELMPLLDKQGNKLEPVTLGECVTMGNGDNLDVLMSKNQMFTPTITQDKSMFKVGTGVDVDYSANVKDGAYESLVFKGRTLVNLCPNLAINYIATSDWDGYHSVGQQSSTNNYNGGKVSYDIKPNTKYFISCYAESLGDNVANKPYRINNVNANTVFTSHLDVTNIGLNKWVVTSKSDLTDGHIVLRCQNTYNRGSIIVKNIMVIEYQEGMENWDIPYFTGMCDVKMPILRNVGKNFLHKHGDVNNTYGVSHFHDGGFTTTSMGSYATFGCIKSLNNPTQEHLDKNLTSVQKGKTYTISCEVRKVSGTSTKLNYLNFSGYNNAGDSYSWTNIGWNSAELNYDYNNTVKLSKTVTCDCSYKYVALAGQVSSDSSNAIYEITNIQLEESPCATPYEDYKTNILRTSEEIVLREVDGVQDTYNGLTGEYVQRIGEIVLDGSEGWGISGFTNDNYFVAYCQATTNFAKANSKIKCDKIQYDSRVSVIDTICEGINIIGDKSLRISMSKSRVSNLSDFTSWLQSNPITVQYELAEPVTTIIKPYATPFAYQDGHVILESGYEGQSLLPEIEYGVVTGRTGQVVQNSKILRKHEQQISSIEDLLLTQIVEMDYERLLLQFDYDLQMLGLSE